MKNSWTVRSLLVLFASFFLVVACANAQPKGKKSYVFKGEVTSVDSGKKNLEVKNENVDGWMAPMVMTYEVANPEVLKLLKKGDRVEATVYDGDYKLYELKKAGPAAPKK